MVSDFISGESLGVCNSPCEVYSRVTGYFRPVSKWNAGKQAEFRARKVFVSGL